MRTFVVIPEYSTSTVHNIIPSLVLDKHDRIHCALTNRRIPINELTEEDDYRQIHPFVFPFMCDIESLVAVHVWDVADLDRFHLR